MESMLRAVDMWVMESVPRKGFAAAVIRRWRAESGLTLAEASERMGIDRSKMSAWESGRNVPNTSDRRRLAELYGTGAAGAVELEEASHRDFLVERDLHGVRAEPTQEWGYAIGPRTPELHLVLTRIAEKDLTPKQLQRLAAFAERVTDLDDDEGEAGAGEGRTKRASKRAS